VVRRWPRARGEQCGCTRLVSRNRVAEGGASVTRRLVKVFGWYDNEWGYTSRLVDLTKQMAAAR